MKLPIDTTNVAFACAGEPTLDVNFETKAPRSDAEGRPLYRVALLAIANGAGEVITVKVGGEPKGLSVLGPVKVIGLEANAWSMGERSGVSFRATRIEAGIPARGAA